ncbi:COG3650 family protein [Brevundimonas sp.]|jgi:uncharacterized membrane protein|uniref:COG3650 family protein n=1 Tax=Brevundimonas sp. TaxID=1871086 RepID=UPI00391C979A|nr:hypothetical protein [Brevundimonas sp.]MCA3716840.1 hypothetical protein [Brevundimonas sp.]
MRPILAVGLVLLAAACSEPAVEPPAPAEPATPAILGGVDLGQPLRALGTEPFWAVDITTDAIAYSAVDSEGVRVSNPGPTVQGTTAVYASAAEDGTALVVTLIATECSDGMSDRTYPLTARVELGGQTLNGCAASVAFLNSEPRP